MGEVSRTLPLGVLRRLAGTLEAGLLALFDAGIPGEHFILAQHGLETFVSLNQCPGDTMSDGTTLPRDTPTDNFDRNIVFVQGIGQHQRLHDCLPVQHAGEPLLIRNTIDNNRPAPVG